MDHIVDKKVFLEFIDELIANYDFRQGAVNGVFPFEDDAQKKAFHVSLAGLPGLLHCSILRLNNKMIAAQIGVCSAETVQLGIFAHSPLWGQYSPGKLHLLLLGIKMQQEGFTYLDLTPGGDEWKERFATEHDVVNVATIYRYRVSLLRRIIAQRIMLCMKILASKFNVSPLQARMFLNRLRGIRPQKVYRKLKVWFYHREELRIYRMDVANVKTLPDNSEAGKDNLHHLLRFDSLESRQTRKNFLYAALQRLESGDQHSYSRLENGCLVHYGWLYERQKKGHFIEVHQDFEYPVNSSVLSDFYSHPKYRDKGYYHSSLVQMLHEATKIPGTEYIYISVLADNKPSRRVIEKIGFTYQGSLFYSNFMGKSNKRSVMLEREEELGKAQAVRL